VRVALLAGGTGAAKLAVGFQQVLVPGDLSIITNTGDDDEFWGLLVCPDTDAQLYRLSGMFNDAMGFGIRDETHGVLTMLRESLGEDTWFTLGDKDIAVHLLRHSLMASGLGLTEAVHVVRTRLGISSAILPMCDEPVRTRIVSDASEHALQEWFVRHRAAPVVRGVRYAGVDDARPTAAVLAALDGADVVVIGPSNPLISIGPILAVLGDALEGRRVIAVSPIVGGESLKGPTTRMLADLGREASAVEVAREWADVASDFVLDRADEASARAVELLGLHAHVCDTVMADDPGAAHLAEALLEIAEGV
jgi:LPPG:FO 2-phospho-L-lactate transferase